MKNTILITGANRGLGLSLAEVFADHGFSVFAGVYPRVERAQIDRLRGRENVYIMDMDVTDIQSVRDAARFVEEYSTSLDVLVSNAAIMAPDENQSVTHTILEPQHFDWIREVIDVNAVGAVRVANVFAPFLLRGDTKLLVNISSESGSIAGCDRTGWFGYCMSKAALNMAGALMQNEWAKHGGQVFLIHPGYMQTYTHGERNMAATYHPDFSAEHIFRLIQDAERYRSPKAVFMDLFGKPLEW